VTYRPTVCVDVTVTLDGGVVNQLVELRFEFCYLLDRQHTGEHVEAGAVIRVEDVADQPTFIIETDRTPVA
jgi:hypothetical protein